MRTLRCHGCAAKEAANDEFAEGGADLGGLHLAVIKKPSGGDGRG